MRRIAIAAVLAAAAAGCSSSSTDPYERGAESFVSSPPGYSGRGGATGGADGVPPTPAAGPATPGSPDTASGGTTRAVEEADVYARVGSTLYVLNAYRGLQVVDLTDLRAPRLVGRAPLGGSPVDLYVRGGVALVLTRDHVEHRIDDATGEIRAWAGSMLWAVNVEQPENPKVVAKMPIEGSLETSRIVGEVLYVVANPSPSYWYGTPTPVGGGVAVGAVAPEQQGSLAVASIDVSRPGAPRLVETKSFPASGWTTHANVTPERITLSFAGYDVSGATTRFQAIDITDPGGAMVLGGQAQVPGLAQDRWGLDFDAATGLFRAVVANGWNSGAALHVYRWATVGQVQKVGMLPLDVPERLTAARFDGPRVYAVTAIVRDPLWVIDTTIPEQPKLAGHLEMPGQLDYVEPRGDRLVAFGHTNEGGGWWQLHVSLVDVAVPSQPALLQRVLFGPDSGWMPATPDDFRKVFLVLDDQGLIVVPFQGWDSTRSTWAGGTQLLSFGHDALAKRGFLAHAGDIKRAFPVDARKLAALSDTSLQTVDATDLDAPAELARIDLARPVLDIEVVGDAAVLATGDGWRSGVEIVVTPAADPDAATPRARLPLSARTARLFKDGPIVWALATDWQEEGMLQAIDLTNPAQPSLRGHVAVERGAGEGGWWWGGLADAVRVGHMLAVHQRIGWCSPGSTGCEPKVLVFDLSNADAPRLAGSVTLPGAAWLGGLVASGSSVWAVHYAWVDGTWSQVRYYADRIDLSGPAPRLAASVNVPGMLLAATDGGRLYTWDVSWPDVPVLDATGSARWTPPTTRLHALTLTSSGTARLDASLPVEGYSGGFVADGGYAYGTVDAYDTATSTSSNKLIAASLEPLALLPRQPVTNGWASIVAAMGGKVFLQTGWPAAELLVFGAESAGPVFEKSVPAPGWPSAVTIAGDEAYVASGPYGVTVIPLGGGPSQP